MLNPDQIKKLRMRLKLTQPQFAELVGIKNVPTISRWENGRVQPSGAALRVMEMIAEQKRISLEPSGEKKSRKERR